jgi:hypothetical protein
MQRSQFSDRSALSRVRGHAHSAAPFTSVWSRPRRESAGVNPSGETGSLHPVAIVRGSRRESFWAYLTRHFENDFQLDRRAERKAGDAIHQSARILVFSEHVLQQF